MFRPLAVLALTLAALAGVTQTPAQAVPNGSFNGYCAAEPMMTDHSPVGPADGALCWPQAPGTTFVIEGPAMMWRLRQVAREVDAKVDGVQFVTDPAARCVDYPGTFCLRVGLERHTTGWAADKGGWFNFANGTTSAPFSATEGYIVLNTYAVQGYGLDTRKFVAAHELGHALGFEHHTDIGIMGQKTYPTFSPKEYRVLRGHYGPAL